MSLFNFSRKKEDKKVPACSCGCSCSDLNKNSVEQTIPCGVNGNNINSIKVLGSGCKSCYALLENTKKAVSNLGLTAKVQYVTDMKEIMVYGVMSLPALVVNEKAVSYGKVLNVSEIENILKKHGA